jgi:hypothetical protein
MRQKIHSRSCASPHFREEIECFAAQYRLKTRVSDEDGTKIIPGRFGQLYEYGDGRLAVMVMPDPPRQNYWGFTRAKLLAAGFVVVQNGDGEGAATFHPANPQRAKIAIRAAGVKGKRVISPEQRDRQIARLRASAGRAV